MSGCEKCVWRVYAEELKEQLGDLGDAALAEALESIEDPSLKMFIKMELNVKWWKWLGSDGLEALILAAAMTCAVLIWAGPGETVSPGNSTMHLSHVEASTEPQALDVWTGLVYQAGMIKESKQNY